MEKSQAIAFIADKLKKYGGKIYNYQGTEFIGIKNPYSDNNIAITFGEEMAMEFTYQTARFKYGDEQDLITHTEKYISGQLVAVEFFLNGKSVFGGSRSVENLKTDTAEDIALWYACGNEKIKDNLLTFFKNDGVSVKIFSYDKKHDFQTNL